VLGVGIALQGGSLTSTDIILYGTLGTLGTL